MNLGKKKLRKISSGSKHTEVFKGKDNMKKLLLVVFSANSFNVTFWQWEDKCEPTTPT